MGCILLYICIFDFIKYWTIHIYADDVQILNVGRALIKDVGQRRIILMEDGILWYVALSFY